MARKKGKRRVAEMTPPRLGGVGQLFLELPVGTLDLHGMRAQQAEGRVRGFLNGHARSSSGKVVLIITGKGNRSEGDAVLPALTRDLLQGDCAHLVADFASQPGGGGYVVRMA